MFFVRYGIPQQGLQFRREGVITLLELTIPLLSGNFLTELRTRQLEHDLGTRWHGVPVGDN